MTNQKVSQYVPLLAIMLLMLTLAGCQRLGGFQEPATWEEQYGAAHQAAVDIDPKAALDEVWNFAGESEVIYSFIRPSGKLIYITFPSPGSASISKIDQNAMTSPPSHQELVDLRREAGNIQISLFEAYQLTAQEKAWLDAQSQDPVRQSANLSGGNASLWSIRYESGKRSSPNYLAVVINVDVQTGEFRRCIFLKGEEGEERSEQCPEVDEDTTD
jgi:hypothetical protein